MEETVIYYADPLLIVHPKDGVQFFGRMDFEYTPSQEDGKRGRAICTRPAREGWTPALNVEDRINHLATQFIWDSRITGITFVGEDDAGEPFTWYVNRVADDYALLLQKGAVPEEVPPESLEDELA